MDFTQYLTIATTNQQTFTVAPDHTAAHLGSGSAKVLSTPSMILFMEITARTMLDELLPEGYSSVGTKVNIEHLAPAAVGSEVQATASLLSLNGNRVQLAVKVLFGEIVVGKGQHERYLIDIERFLQRTK